MSEGEAITVAVRIRPLNSRELGMNEEVICSAVNKQTFEIQNGGGDPTTFNFDFVYGMDTTQQTVQDEIGDMLLNNALEGYNACIFAYGQTGAGKSWSIMGSTDKPELRGLLPRISEELFTRMAGDGSVDEYRITCTYLEIYNEKLKDLLNTTQDSPTLDVRKHPTAGIGVPGLTEKVVANFPEIDGLLDQGQKKRMVAKTGMNEQSSRSHAVFTLNIKQVLKDKRSRNAQLNIVDLAGSERQKKTGAAGDTLKEGAAINQSLTVLGQVILKLGSEKAAKGKGGASHVPFRNSKLTYLLSDSLSGNSKTVMMAATSPAKDNFDETMSTLRFASSVKKIKTKATKQEQVDMSSAEALKALRQALEETKAKLVASEEENVKLKGIIAEGGSVTPEMLQQMAANSAIDAAGSAGARRSSRNPVMPNIHVIDDDDVPLCDGEMEDDLVSEEEEEGDRLQSELEKQQVAFVHQMEAIERNVQLTGTKQEKDGVEALAKRFGDLRAMVEQANFIMAWMMEYDFMPRSQGQSVWLAALSWACTENNKSAPSMMGTVKAQLRVIKEDGFNVLNEFGDLEFFKILGKLEDKYDKCVKKLNYHNFEGADGEGGGGGDNGSATSGKAVPKKPVRPKRKSVKGDGAAEPKKIVKKVGSKPGPKKSLPPAP